MTDVPTPVTLVPSVGQGGTITWQMGVNGAAPQGPPYPNITVGNKNTSTITFTIQNGSGQNFTFASTPILVPPKTGAFDAPTVSGTTMSIKDHNPQQAHIPYVLMFNGGAPKLDPIIDNDGGGTGMWDRFLASPVLDMAAGALLVAVLFFILRPMFRRQ
jgi:hypothetical protein